MAQTRLSNHFTSLVLSVTELKLKRRKGQVVPDQTPHLRGCVWSGTVLVVLMAHYATAAAIATCNGVGPDQVGC